MNKFLSIILLAFTFKYQNNENCTEVIRKIVRSKAIFPDTQESWCTIICLFLIFSNKVIVKHSYIIDNAIKQPKNTFSCIFITELETRSSSVPIIPKSIKEICERIPKKKELPTHKYDDCSRVLDHIKR